jgi:hypothetical protein
MKVIFLDIDGVLTTTMWSSNYSEFNPVCTNGLLKLLDADPSLRLVISSVWRLGSAPGSALDETTRLYKELNRYGLIEKLHEDWRTISNHDWIRGQEIEEWLSRHEVENYLILDDDSDMLDDQKEHHVCTSTTNGLLLEHLDKSLEVLKIGHMKVKWNTDFIKCERI